MEESGAAAEFEILPYIPQAQQQRSGFLIDYLFLRGLADSRDYLDLLMLGNRRYGVLLARLPQEFRRQVHDSNILQRAIRKQSPGSSPAGAIRALESVLEKHLNSHPELHAAYAVFHPGSRCLSFATTVTSPIFLFRQNQKRIYRLVSDDGGPLRRNSARQRHFAPTRSETVRLQQHDLILFISESLLECKNTWGEQFDLNRLKSFLDQHGHMQPTPLLRKLQNEIEEFTLGEPLPEDVVVVAVKNMLSPEEAGGAERAVDLEERFLSLEEEYELWRVSSEHPDLRLRELLSLVGGRFHRLDTDRIRFYLLNEHRLWKNGHGEPQLPERRVDAFEQHFHQELVQSFPIRQLLYRKYEFRGNTDAISRALEYYQNGHFQESLIEFVKVRKTIAESESVYCFFGNLYLLLNMTIKARQEYLKALRLNPRSVHAFLALGYIALLHKDYEGAVHYLSTAVRLDQNQESYERFLQRLVSALDQQKGMQEWIS